MGREQKPDKQPDLSKRHSYASQALDDIEAISKYSGAGTYELSVWKRNPKQLRMLSPMEEPQFGTYPRQKPPSEHLQHFETCPCDEPRNPMRKPTSLNVTHMPSRC